MNSSKIQADLFMEQARTAAAQGRMEEVVEALRQAVQAAPFHAEANAHLAWIDSQNGSYRSALAAYGRLLLCRPWSVHVLLRTIQCTWLLGRQLYHHHLAPLAPFAYTQKGVRNILEWISHAGARVLEKAKHRNSFISQWIRHHQRIRRQAPVNPYEYYKVSEIDFVLHHLPKNGGICVDMGCGRSAFPSFLTARGYRVIAVELHWESLSVQQHLCGSHHGESLHPLAADFLNMPLLDSSVDAVTLISTIEHVPGDGDRQTVQRLARILKPGGGLIITMPVAARYREEWTAGTIGHVYAEALTHSGGQGFMRVYDPTGIQERLIRPSGLTLVRLAYFGERTQWGWLGLGRNFVDHRGGVHPSVFAAPLNLLFTRELQEWELIDARWSIACVYLRKNSLS